MFGKSDSFLKVSAVRSRPLLVGLFPLGFTDLGAVIFNGPGDHSLAFLFTQLMDQNLGEGEMKEPQSFRHQSDLTLSFFESNGLTHFDVLCP